MVIIYLFNLTETKDALFVHVCFCALARTSHTASTRRPGRGSHRIVSDDGCDKTHRLEDQTNPETLFYFNLFWQGFFFGHGFTGS